MNVSPVISSLDLVNSIFATTSAQRVAFSIVTPATSTASMVDISALGQLLSAASILNQSLSTDNPGFGTVLAATQLFVNAFNSVLQSDSLQNTSNSYAGSLFGQAWSSGNSVLDQLATVGVDYQPASPGTTGLLTIDVQKLQAAYSANPSAAISQLVQGTRVIGQSVVQLASMLAQTDMLAQISSTQLVDNSVYAALTNFPTVSTNLNVFAELGASNTTSGITTLIAETVLSGATTTTALTTTPEAISSLISAASTTTSGITTLLAETVLSGAATTTGLTTTPEAISSLISAASTTPSGITGLLAETVLSGAGTTTGLTTTPEAISSLISAASTAPSGINGLLAETALSGVTTGSITDVTTTPAVTTAAEVNATQAATTMTEANATPAATTTAEANATPAATTAAEANATPAATTAAEANATPAATTTAEANATSAATTAAEANVTAAMTTGTTTTAVTTVAELATTQAALAAPIFGTTGTTTSAATTTAVNGATMNIDASDPAVAAAIAAYHLVDGIFDSAWPHGAGLLPPISYSEIRAVAKIQPAKLDLSA